MSNYPTSYRIVKWRSKFGWGYRAEGLVGSIWLPIPDLRFRRWFTPWNWEFIDEDSFVIQGAKNKRTLASAEAVIETYKKLLIETKDYENPTVVKEIPRIKGEE